MRRKLAFIIAAVAIIGAAGALAWGYYGAAAVEADVAREGSVQRRISGTGNFAAGEERTVVSIHGMVLREVAVDEGDGVDENQLLVRGDPSDLVVRRDDLIAERDLLRQEIAAAERNLPAQLRGAESALEAAQQNLREAERDAETMRRLYEAGAAPENEYRRAQLAVTAAEADLSAARAAVQQLQSERDLLSARSGRAEAVADQIAELERKIAEHEITAPADMAVAEVFVQQGDVVSPGTPLVLLHGPELKVKMDLLAADAREVFPGAHASISGDAVGDEAVSGSVTRIHPHAVEKVSELGVRQRRVPVEVTPGSMPEGVRPGYPADVDIVVDEREGLVIDRDAVFQLDGEDYVFQVRDDRAHLTGITVELEGDDDVLVSSGITAGDAVVVNPPRDLEDAARVRVVGE